MPESSSAAKAIGAPHCARCHAAEPRCTVRTEKLCVSCFSKYISMKMVKRLEANKIRAAFNETSKKILIPISSGVSSLCLLQILDEHMRKRAEQGRHGGYSISLIFIDEENVADTDADEVTRVAKLLETHFPSYPLHRVALQDCFEYGIDIDHLMDQQSPDTIERSMENVDRLRYVLQATGSPSSRSDILDILRRRLIETFAKQQAFDYILYGDSTTRLAERTLADTAKGRGVAVSYTHADRTNGPGVSYVYPLRDLLRKELVMYAETLCLPFSAFSRPSKAIATPSLKNSSIDDLMRQYVDSVEENYPSVVANVVRTTAKLSRPRDTVSHFACVLCKTPYFDEQHEGAGLMQLPGRQAPRQNEQLANLCYGCERNLYNNE